MNNSITVILFEQTNIPESVIEKSMYHLPVLLLLTKLVLLVTESLFIIMSNSSRSDKGVDCCGAFGGLNECAGLPDGSVAGDHGSLFASLGTEGDTALQGSVNQKWDYTYF